MQLLYHQSYQTSWTRLKLWPCRALKTFFDGEDPRLFSPANSRDVGVVWRKTCCQTHRHTFIATSVVSCLQRPSYLSKFLIKWYVRRGTFALGVVFLIFVTQFVWQLCWSIRRFLHLCTVWPVRSASSQETSCCSWTESGMLLSWDEFEDWCEQEQGPQKPGSPKTEPEPWVLPEDVNSLLRCCLAHQKCRQMVELNEPSASPLVTCLLLASVLHGHLKASRSQSSRSRREKKSLCQE